MVQMWRIGGAARKTSRRRSIEKAMRRAAAGGTFDGAQALDEVSSADGKWDWALLGPDPHMLPLAGGGSGSIEGMASVMKQHAHSYGLMRMAFSEGDVTKVFYIFLHAADMDNIKSFAIKERGDAMLMEPKMEAAVRRYIDYDVKIDVNSQRECNVPSIIELLQDELRGRPVSNIISVENYIVPKPQVVEKRSSIKGLSLALPQARIAAQGQATEQ